MNPDIKYFFKQCTFVTPLANVGSIRRSDIIVLNSKRNLGLIINYWSNHENCQEQPKLVDDEKLKMYIIAKWIGKIQNFKFWGF